MQILFNLFPKRLKSEGYKEIAQLFADDDALISNLLYLEGHELIESGLIAGSNNYSINTVGLRITVKGIDFMQKDGGLSAILNVQTIKFYRDAVVVLEDLIALSGMNDAEKEKAKSKLFELSELTAVSLKTVVQTVTTAGLAALMK
ncbi:hypothetical protein ACQPT2_22360 [Erwinia amylovora]